MVEISCIAFCATSRTSTFGFSSFFFDGMSNSGGNVASGSANDDEMTFSFSGGNSSRSEKLTLDDEVAGAAIIGSAATRGVSCTGSGSTTAADIAALCAPSDADPLTSKSLMSRAPEPEFFELASLGFALALTCDTL